LQKINKSYMGYERITAGEGARVGDVVAKLWSFCNTLRHDGMNYTDYIEQLTFLLFLKMARLLGIVSL
jgi:type I restriction-modification system DNA methylase subunit